MNAGANSTGAGPSRPLQSPVAPIISRGDGEQNGNGNGNGNGEGSLWSEILGSTDRSKGLKRKNVIVLSERHHGRSHLLAQLSSGSKKKRPTRSNQPHDQNRQSRNGRKGLALGYEVVEIGDGDEDSVPPLSIFYPPSSHPSLLRLVPKALPPKSLSDTAVVIVLDWTKPSSMVHELLNWLVWVEEWASSSADRDEAEELREKLQSHLQHYSEPPVAPAGTGTGTGTSTGAGTAYAGVGPLLPLGQGTLTLNSSGIPIVVVCTKADLMDSVGDEIGMKGGGWEERTDWIQQALRTVCLAYGASLFYTAPTQPTTYILLRTYLLHRLYSLSPPLNAASSNPTSNTQTDAIQHTSSTRFPFPYRASVLDRDAVMVPSGWDSWGKINVLREGFDPARIGKAWAASLSKKSEGDDGQDDEEMLEDIWLGMIPDTERGPKPTNGNSIASTTEPEQTFLSRQLDILMKDPNRDPRQSFRHAAATVVGPMSGSEGLSLPGVEKAMADMEGLEKGEELKEKFARFGRKDSGRGAAGPLSPTGPAPSGTPTPSMPNEALHNFFQGLLANRSKTGSGSGSASASASAGGTATAATPSTKAAEES
ncbi:hypothetical protein IAT40_001252 [Kwoniella sp. CBS 6097]